MSGRNPTSKLEQLHNRKAAQDLSSVWQYLLSVDARYLDAREVAEIVAVARVLYISLGGSVRERALLARVDELEDS